MNYAIIEGETSKAECIFWQELIKYKFKKVNKLICTGNKSGLPVKLIETISESRCKFGSNGETSRVLICMNTADLQGMVQVMQENLEKVLFSEGGIKTTKGRRVGIRHDVWQFETSGVTWLEVEITTNYCFELCLLQFSGLLNWVYSKEARWYSLDIRLRERQFDIYKTTIADGRPLKQSKSLRKWVGAKLGIKLTRDKCDALSEEQLAIYLLEAIIREDYTGFRVNKDRLGKCWFCDCLDRDDANCPCANRVVSRTDKYADGDYLVDDGDDSGRITGEFSKEWKHTDAMVCSLLKYRKEKTDGWQPTSEQKADALVKSSPILGTMYTKYRWLHH